MSNERQVTEETKAVSVLKGVICSNPGKHTAPVYKRVFDAEMKRFVVKKVDETDLYEFIQASKNETDLAVLQKRFIALGEIPAVDPTLASNDLTVFPNNIHEVYDMVNDVDANFKSLPESIQKIFGDSGTYMQAILNGTYQATILNAMKPQAPADKKVEEQVNE